MTFTFKLARRIAVSRTLLLLSLFLAPLQSCGTPIISEGFTPPDSTAAVVISVSPKLDTIRTSDSVQLRAQGLDAQGNTVTPEVDWFASGGTISSSGVFRSTSTGRFTMLARYQRRQQLFDTATVVVIPSLATVSAVVISPASATLSTGGSKTFSASATMSDGGTAPVAVTWSATGGSISTSGDYTAGATAGSFRVIATESAGTHADTAAVTITAPTLAAVIVAPGSVSLAASATQQFSATGRLSNGASTSVTVNWTATGGTISSSGLYTAGTTSGNFRVIATQAGGTLADTALIGIAVAAPTLRQVVLTPATTTLLTGATQQFAASGLMSDGSSKGVSVTYTATGGTINGGGLYTAGSTPGSYRVIATQSGGTLADTSAVTVTAATLQQVVLTPATVTLQSGRIQQFSASGRLSDGSVSSVSVTYSATGGSISTGGLYTAGSTAGTFRVIATQAGGTLADTSSVTITAATLTQVILLPATVAVARGAAQQFTVSGILSNGATTTPAVSYSATGGTISTGGLYTAGSTAGTFRVIAVQQGGTLADTSAVTITSTAPPTLTQVILTPAGTSLIPGGSLQFTVTGRMSDGSTSTPAVVYTATGGTITTGGAYTAGSTAGSFRVIATQQGGTLADTSGILITTPALDEPAYSAGVSTRVYQDGFDSYHLPVDGSGTLNQATFPTTARMQTNGTYNSNPAVYMSASLDVGRSGSGKSLRSNNTGPGGPPLPDGTAGGVVWGGPHGSGFVLPPKSARQVFQFWFKTNPGGGPNIYGTKWFEWWAADTPIPATDTRMQLTVFGNAYAVPGGHTAFNLNDGLGRLGNAHGGYASQPVGPYFDQVNDGNWHRLTIAWLSPTGGATRDGYVRAWLDGTKIIDCEQATVGVTPPGGTKPWCIQAEVDAIASFRLGHFQSWPEHVNGADRNWSLWVDDFSWWTEP